MGAFKMVYSKIKGFFDLSGEGFSQMTIAFYILLGFFRLHR